MAKKIKILIFRDAALNDVPPSGSGYNLKFGAEDSSKFVPNCTATHHRTI
jgi:hypothetical protein